jgi:hypothetical protein
MITKQEHLLSKKLASCGVIISSKTMANNDADKKKKE